jgi:hypothetical protein
LFRVTQFEGNEAAAAKSKGRKKAKGGPRAASDCTHASSEP